MWSGGWKKSKKSINAEGGFFFLWRGEFFKISKHDFTFIRDESTESVEHTQNSKTLGTTYELWIWPYVNSWCTIFSINKLSDSFGIAVQPHVYEESLFIAISRRKEKRWHFERSGNEPTLFWDDGFFSDTNHFFGE